MAHCAPEMRAAWREALRERGVVVGEEAGAGRRRPGRAGAGNDNDAAEQVR